MPYWKRKDSPYYHGRVWNSQAGDWTSDRSLRVRDARAADSACREWERRLADPAYAAAQSVTLEKTLAGLGQHLANLRSRGKLSTATTKYYEGKFGPLLRVFGRDAMLSDFKPAILEQYRAARHQEGSSEHNTTKELIALKYAFRHAKLNGQFAGDLGAIFPKMALEYAPRERFLTWDEVCAFVALPCGSPNPNTPKRNAGGNDVAAMIAFSVATGAEAKCIDSAIRADVATDYVLLRGTKNALRWRTVPIVTDRQRALMGFAMRHAEGTEGKLFSGTTSGLRSTLRRTAEALEVPKASPNDLRRTFAVMMREAGFPLELIAPLMGHADTTMLQRVYGRLTPEQLRERLILALNASAALSKSVGRTRPQRLVSATSAGRPDPLTRRNVEPTPGLEPGTYGLRNHVRFPSSTVKPPELVYVA